MDDLARLALIRAVLATFNEHHESEDGDRHLSDTALCIEMIDAIADGPATEGRALSDGWITPEAAAEIRGAQDRRAGRPWFWVVTLTWQDPAGPATATATGSLSPDQAAALRTRDAAYPAVVEAGRRGMSIPDGTPATVTFFSIEPDDLTAADGR